MLNGSISKSLSAKLPFFPLMLSIPRNLEPAASSAAWEPPQQAQVHLLTPRRAARSINSSTYQTWERQCKHPQTTPEQGFLCAEAWGPSLPSNVANSCLREFLSLLTAGLIGARVTAPSRMIVFSPALSLCPWDILKHVPHFFGQQKRSHGSAATECGWGSCPGGALRGGPWKGWVH